MKHESIMRLFPTPAQEADLRGLYLEHRLHTCGTADRPYVYSNFITSLDGRIAIADATHASHQVPGSITNPRDWRLYQELAGQADILVTSGRYFRQSSIGEAQDTLPVGQQADFEDIRQWRLGQGLTPQPDIAILSASLDIPPASLAPYRHRNVIVVTGNAAEPDKVSLLESEGVRVIAAGNGHHADGERMIEQLAAAGYRSIYAIAGSAVFHTLVSSKMLDRLYLTLACQLLGGRDIDTLLYGDLLDPATSMSLVSLYHDPHAPEGGQLFGIFDTATVSHTAPGRD